MTLVEFTPEARQFAHDFDEVALGLRILMLNALLFLQLLRKVSLQFLVLLQSVCELDLVLLNDAPSNLLVDCLACWAQILIYKPHACPLHQ